MKKVDRKSNYSRKLLDPRWQKKRLEILQRDNWACQKCGDKESTLHVHHRVYWHDSEPWEISERYLITMCGVCHEKETGLLYESRIVMKAAVERIFFADEIIHIMKGFRDIYIQKNPKHTAKIIRYALSSPEAMSALEKMYTEGRDQ